MLSRSIFVLMLFVGSAAASAMSDCQSSCEKNYKNCTTAGKASPNACKMDYEKCRKQCVKKDGTPSPS